MNTSTNDKYIAEFMNVFTCHFDADVTNIDSDEQVTDAITSCTYSVVQRIPDVHSVTSYLQEALSHWDWQHIAPFDAATCQDWLFDERSEQTLKRIMRGIISELEERG
ncbi:MAG: hypothetical protein EOO38_14260 [Cytophagaceae bacterium]|nr:MAG: hypothetical protein EOO38_14260 [Cytophagaceae bacterium]